MNSQVYRCGRTTTMASGLPQITPSAPQDTVMLLNPPGRFSPAVSRNHPGSQAPKESS